MCVRGFSYLVDEIETLDGHQTVVIKMQVNACSKQFFGKLVGCWCAGKDVPYCVLDLWLRRQLFDHIGGELLFQSFDNRCRRTVDSTGFYGPANPVTLVINQAVDESSLLIHPAIDMAPVGDDV